MIKSDVSDHLPIFLSIQLTKKKTSGRCYKKRILNRHNITSFKEQLSFYFIGDIRDLMELRMKFITRFWQH